MDHFVLNGKLAAPLVEQSIYHNKIGMAMFLGGDASLSNNIY